MPEAIELVRRLADGDCHSGEALARELGISRTAVWKGLRRATARYGLKIQSLPGQGYRLERAMELLDGEQIRSAMSAHGRARLAGLEIHDQIDSTNQRLMALAAGPLPSGSVCLAEHQSAGRGRRGRTWVSPFAGGLCLSLLWRYPLGPGALGGISLAAGAVVAGVLERLGVRGVGLKWPNDLLWQRRKLGGLLLEVAGETQGPSRLVVGLGLNLVMEVGSGEGIDQPWVDLREALAGRVPGRNRLAAALIEALLGMLADYGGSGPAPWLDEWARFDLPRGQPVRVEQGERTLVGEYLGIDPDGVLRLMTAEGLVRVGAGEVSLRPGVGSGPRTI
jgi:BirA family transcriptional regulator, biotin operon repressor / biotin---[acetyl-CoA-carboxylase] ligase